ncbi:uncharacterized protein LOC108252773, partial [Diaphorina citri]|uniref:Uncharacterized protein LOC108252773 n=1 Tax=Diaphorina citri TaxID=121845 RepID=A0A1S4EFB9_DIACI
MSREQEIIRNILDELLDGNDSDFSDLDDSGDEDELTLAASTSENRIPEPQQQSASLYKYSIKSRRWYIYIFWHSIIIATMNSWLVYRDNSKTLGIPFLPLRKFQTEVATAL